VLAQEKPVLVRSERHDCRLVVERATSQAVAADGARWHPERAAAEARSLGV
jgi:hypothetical protein